jgi:hypothetical protein
MIHEQKNVPRLVDLSRHPSIIKKNNFNNLNNLITKPKIKWNLNKVLLVGFLLFSIFFLWNCKYGLFRVKEETIIQGTPS